MNKTKYPHAFIVFLKRFLSILVLGRLILVCVPYPYYFHYCFTSHDISSVTTSVFTRLYFSPTWQKRQSFSLLFRGQVKLGGNTAISSATLETVKTATIDGDFIFGVSGQSEAHLAVLQCYVCIRERFAIAGNCSRPLATVILDIDSNVEIQISIVLDKFICISDMKGNRYVCAAVGDIQIKEVARSGNATYCIDKYFPRWCR